MKAVSSETIISAAMECEKTPFVHQGRVPGVGLDCAGLLVHIFKTHDLPYVDEKGYGRDPFRGQIEKILDSQPSLERQRSKALFPGALLLMRIKRHAQHVAIFTGHSIIHSYAGSRAVVEHTLTEDWKRRIIRVYKIVER